MRRGHVQLGVVALAAIVLAIVLVLLPPFRAELADVVPRSAEPAADAAAELPPAGPDAASVPGASDAARPSAPCAPSEPATRSAAQERVFARGFAQARERLLVSRDAEHLAAAAMLTRNERDRVEDITTALALDRNNAAVAWAAVRICDGVGANVNCPAQQWEDELLRLDGQNSAVWINVAVRRLERGERDKALEAMQRAAAAAETREYWPETVELLERGLEAAGGYSFPERAYAAFGIAAAHLPNYSRYVNVCRAQSQSDPVWADACLRYGERAERQGKTVAGQTIARSIQIAVLEIVGDDASARAIRERRGGVTDEQWRRADSLIASGPRPFSRYLAEVRESGEAAAVAYMAEEAGRSPGSRGECAVN